MATEETKTTEEVTTNKKSTWLSRIWSAAVGAVVAVGAMFGITQPQIEAQNIYNNTSFLYVLLYITSLHK